MQARPASRSERLLARVESWAHRGAVRAVMVRVGVSVVGPLLVLAGVAMLVLPGPGLVVMALGTALLALEYPWARRLLLFAGRGLARARRLVLPADASGARRLLGLASTGALVVATTALTAAITAYVGSAVV